MSSDKDLDRFREEWKRELTHSKNEQEIAEIDHCTAAVFTEQNFALPSNANSNVCNAPMPIVNDESSHEFDEERFKVATSKAIEAIEEANEYYPFKILTHFLNEAPNPKKLNATRNDQRNNFKGMTYAKRKYFISEAKNIIKKIKENESIKETKKQEDHFLDIFIADLDEINEIPFFDTSLPREVALKIFQHFDMKTLCRCSQVSRSWRSLADDELLWFHICQKLGFEQDVHLKNEENWKSIVRRNIQNQRLQITNWKARIGKPYNLAFPRGGILCAAHSHDYHIVAGYTSCHVRSWDTMTGDICTYSASNTALVLDEQAEDLGRIHNEIKHVRTTALITAASFKHGFVDVWKNEKGTEPIQTIRFRSQEISSLSALDVDEHCSLVAATQGSRVQLAEIGNTEENNFYDFEMSSQITQVDWLSSGCLNSRASLLITCNNSVHVKKIVPLCERDSQLQSSLQSQELIEIHNIIWAPITAVGFREHDSDVAVGFNLYAPSTQVKLNVYDVVANQLKASLTGHTWLISCVHLPTSVPQQLVTGSADRKIRQYDIRAGLSACTTLIGHAAKVNTVQMDDWKIVSGDDAGFVHVWDQRMCRKLWDQRMCRKLWDIYNRHPVSYCQFDDRLLIIGNVPYQKFHQEDEFETVSSLRYRGTVQVYDFMANQQTQGVPDICLSSYNEPEASDYNIGLTVPYDSVE